MQWLLLGAAGAAAGAVLMCNMSAWLIPAPQLATLDYLAQAKLQTLDAAKRNFSLCFILFRPVSYGKIMGQLLWQSDVLDDLCVGRCMGTPPGGIKLLSGYVDPHQVDLDESLVLRWPQEAKQLSSLHDMMATHGVGLHAVVHETLGAEEFKSFIRGDVYYDPEKIFYGPVERWTSIAGIFNFISIGHMIKSMTKDTKGNVAGEGRLLGAVYVIGPGNDGILYQHHEKVIGDTADITSIREAIQKIKKMQ